MTYKTTLIASLSAVALVLGASQTFADPGAARGGPGIAPARPAFPTFNRSMPHPHHHHHHRGAGFFPGGVGVFYGLPDEVDRPVVETPPLKTTDDIRFTCVYDIPWDYVHRCPHFNTPR